MAAEPNLPDSRNGYCLCKSVLGRVLFVHHADGHSMMNIDNVRVVRDHPKTFTATIVALFDP